MNQRFLFSPEDVRQSYEDDQPRTGCKYGLIILGIWTAVVVYLVALFIEYIFL